MATVSYLDPEPNGLATMLGGLIEANLAAHPERTRLLKPGLVSIAAPDAGVAVSIRMRPGVVQIANGVRGRPRLTVRTNSDTLMELSSVPLRFGLPNAMTREGREVTAKLMNGTIRVKGMFRSLATLMRLNRLLSVA